MVKLNFLPHRLLRQRRRQQQFYWMLCASVGAGVASVAAIDMFLEQQVSQQTALVQLLKSEHEKLDVRQLTLKDFQQQTAELDQRRQQLIGLLQQQHQVPELLQDLAQKTPAKVSLRTLKQQKNNITLSGNASSPEDVMRLLANLREGDSTFRHAELQEVHADQETSGYRFVIHAVAQASDIPDAQ